MSDLPRSKAAFSRACALIPGGVNSPARAFGGVGGEPVFFQRGEGAYMFDLDGNRYIDYVGSWGPLILGHAHPDVVQAVREALANGSSFGAPTELETELAEIVVAAVNSVEKVRFVNSGTEASMTAVRLARGVTGRDKIVKFAGCYHGHVDSLLVQAGSSATTLGVPSSPGVPDGFTRYTLIAEFNNLESVQQILAANRGEVAGIFLEPVVGNMGTVAPAPGFLEGVRELATEHGCLMALDEVMTGFRLAFGGAQELFGVDPDLTIMGKVIGGGLPVGAVGGRAELMNQLMPSGPVFQAGTLSGNPLAMASGIATLSHLRDNAPYNLLEDRSAQLAAGLDRIRSKYEGDTSIARVGSMLTLFFNPGPVRNYAQASASDTAAFGRFFWAMLRRGIYLPCSQFEAWFVSTAHSQDDIELTVAAAEESLAECASANS